MIDRPLASKHFRSDGQFVVPKGVRPLEFPTGGSPDRPWQPPNFRSSASLGLLAGLKGYNPLVLATQFSIQVDLVVAEPTDAQSVERAILAALLTKEFGLVGMAVVTAKAVILER